MLIFRLIFPLIYIFFSFSLLPYIKKFHFESSVIYRRKIGSSVTFKTNYQSIDLVFLIIYH